MKHIVIISVLLGAVLLYLLSQASANTELFSANYPLLLVLNLSLAGLLIVLIGYQLWVLRRRLREGVFGTKLAVRILLMLSLMAVVPGAVVYGVSVLFLKNSIESWFDVRVDNALAGGLSLGQTALDHLLRDLTKKAESMALALAEQPANDRLGLLNTLREQIGVQEATLFSQRGSILAFSSSERVGLLPEIPNQTILRQVRQQQPYTGIEALPDHGLLLRVVVPVNVLSLTEDIRLLQLIQPVPSQLAHDAEAVQSVYRDYQELSVSRLGFKRLYGVTLTLALLLALLSAFALAFLLTERLSAPLGLLAQGTRAVAKGDFSLMHPVDSRDELGALMQSFNSMTRQLAEARAAAEVNQRQVEAAKTYLESILAHLSSGVLVFDERFYLRTVNPAAAQMLSIELADLRGLKLLEWGRPDTALNAFAHALADLFNEGGRREWQKQIEYAGPAGNRILLVRGSSLPGVIEAGYIAVFDDITHLLQAERDAAWGEVARRLAHEIKNPLTPIQLSAERLQLKLVDKLSGPDADMLMRATHTIVNQVGAMKNMVDAFKEYARSPKLALEPLDLNQLVHDVLGLYESLASVIQVETEEGELRVLGDTTLLRQVIHNLLQNAEDATSDQAHPQILVRTEGRVNDVRLTVRDNGTGFPEHILTKAFEPYVTTKPKGTGLGLAVVRKIVEEHKGAVHIENLKSQGASITIILPRAESV